MTTTPPSGSQPRTPPDLGEVATLIDGGDMDCGSGLLLLITRAMRRLEDGDRLGIRSAEPSVLTDLPVWAELVGHTVAAEVAESSAEDALSVIDVVASLVDVEQPAIDRAATAARPATVSTER